MKTKHIESIEDFRAYMAGREAGDAVTVDVVLKVHGEGDVLLGSGHVESLYLDESVAYATLYEGEAANVASDAVHGSYDEALVAVHDAYDSLRRSERRARMAEDRDGYYGWQSNVEWSGPYMVARGTPSSRVVLFEDNGGGLSITREHAPSVLLGLQYLIGTSTFAEAAANILEEEGMHNWDGFEQYLPWECGREYWDLGQNEHIATYDGATGEVELHSLPGLNGAAYIGIDPEDYDYDYDYDGNPYPPEEED